MSTEVLSPEAHSTLWSAEQWARVKQTVRGEAARARVAATFLPLVGPLPSDADFVRAGRIGYRAAGSAGGQETQRISVEDRDVIQLTTLQVKVYLRGAQMADPQQTSALDLFRRAANVLARLEDAIVLTGQVGADQGPPAEAVRGLPAIWKVTGGQASPGLLGLARAGHRPAEDADAGRALVRSVSARIGELEGRGHFGPFAAVLGEDLFLDAHSPNASLALPSDRILPLLGGGPLLRSSSLPPDKGLVVALGAAPIEFVIATDVSASFLQVTTDPAYVFRVHEKIALRVKEDDAVELLSRDHG